MNAVELRGVWAGYDGYTVLKDVNLEVEEGVKVLFMGPNASGKSTLLKVISGLIRPERGEALIYGFPAHKTEARRLVGYLPEAATPYPMLSVRMNVEYVMRLSGSLSSPGVDETLELFGLKGYEKKYPTTLSAGLNQRLSLAMTWVKGTPIVALDEPFDFLDEEAKQSLSRFLLESKKTVIVATNMEPPFASRFRVIHMKELKKEMGLAL